MLPSARRPCDNLRRRIQVIGRRQKSRRAILVIGRNRRNQFGNREFLSFGSQGCLHLGERPLAAQVFHQHGQREEQKQAARRNEDFARH